MSGLTWQQGGAGIEWAGCAAIVIAAAVLAVRAVRAWQRQRRIEDLDLAATRAMDLGDLVIHPAQEEHAAWQAGRLRQTRADLPAVRCHRHRTGSSAFPCTCDTETGGRPVSDTEFGGHEFAYESSTDLFRCTRCRRYEVTVRQGEQVTPCEGDVPGEPMVLNAW